MKLSDEWILGLIVALIFGNFGYTSAVAVWLSNKLDEKIEKICENHLKHLEERIKRLEN